MTVGQVKARYEKNTAKRKGARQKGGCKNFSSTRRMQDEGIMSYERREKESVEHPRHDFTSKKSGDS